LSHINENLNFERFSFQKILKYQICPVGAELFHAYGWTDRQIWQS